MKVHNYMEDVVEHILPNVIKKDQHLSVCEKCQADIKAITLNQLKPHYISTRKGEVYSKVSEMKIQFEADVIQAITHAIKIVKGNPGHD